MHWSGKVRIFAVIVCISTMGILQYGLGVRWYFVLPLGALAYIATPVVIGIIWGMGDRKYLKELEGKARRGEPLD